MFRSTAQKSSFSWKQAGLTLASLALTASPIASLAQAKVVGGVPGAVAKSISHGPVASSQDLRLTVWLTLPNKAEFDKKVADLYTEGSPSFHKWLSTEELLAYAPSDSTVKLVKAELAKQGLQVIEDGRDNFSIAVHGSADKVQAAFGTKIEEFERNGATFHANTSEAKLTGAAAAYVQSVSGLNSVGMKPHIAYAKDPKTGKPRAPIAFKPAASAAAASPFTNKCFQTASAFTFGTPGSLPTGVYFGNVYDNSTQACGYTPTQMQSLYGLGTVYNAGLKGSGQTIVIVDAYGSPTIQSDANVFNAQYGLPQLTSSNFKVIYPSGQPLDPALGISLGWNVETSLDVEWSHAIAPGAKIVLLAAAAQDDQDLEYAVEYAAIHKLGSVVSNSYGSPEIEDGPAALDAYNQVIELGAAAGISVNFSTGDGGDEGLGSPVGAAAVPADSPYATAVGGTSVGIPGGSGSASETGWGNNQTELAESSMLALDPPVNFGNAGGAGGGESVYFAKPAWQKALPGGGRQLPDVSLEADPYTGAIIVFTSSGEVVTEAIGGTSLSCPMFSAFWALANEKAGHLLGQAAPIISKMPSAALNDIVPVGSATNVTGTIIDSSGATFYSSDALAAPLEGTTTYLSTIWPIQGFFIDLTFGTDTSLGTAKGWDNVTGYGTPRGMTFINAAAK